MGVLIPALAAAQNYGEAQAHSLWMWLEVPGDVNRPQTQGM